MLTMTSRTHTLGLSMLLVLTAHLPPVMAQVVIGSSVKRAKTVTLTPPPEALAAAETGKTADAAEIIRAADRIRAPEDPFRYMLDLIEMKDEKVVARQRLDVAMRISKPGAGQEGDAKALVRFVQPKKDQGKALLSNLDKLWFYDPRLRRPIPIARQQRLIGQVANGDIVAADFDFSYRSKIVGTEPCGQVQCYKLVLERRWPSVTYPKITYWVEVESKRPFKSEFLSTNGLVMKTAFYKDYRPALGRERPHEIMIVNALQKSHYTRMLYSSVRFENVPETYFQREYLERLQ